MKFASYNIQFGRGRDGRFDLARIAEAVAGADVIALQEVERHWPRSGDIDQPAELARLLDGWHWVYGPGVDLHAGGGNRRRQFGNMLLSRTPILSSRNHLLPKRASLGPMSLQRSALEAVIETRVGMLRCYSLHLTHLSAVTRLAQVEALLGIHTAAPAEGAAIAAGEIKPEWQCEPPAPALGSLAVLMGDFNAESDSAEYALLVGPPSDYGGTRVSSPAGFVDAWVASGHQEAAGVTSDINGRPVRIDYCLVSGALGTRIRGAWIDDQAEGSDHQPMWTELDL